MRCRSPASHHKPNPLRNTKAISMTASRGLFSFEPSARSVFPFFLVIGSGFFDICCESKTDTQRNESIIALRKKLSDMMKAQWAARREGRTQVVVGVSGE